MQRSRYHRYSLGSPGRLRPLALWVTCCLVAVGGLGCQQPPNAPLADPLPDVAVAQPVVLSLVEWDEYVGRLAAVDSVQVRSRVSGYLKSTHFAEGQLVRAGQLLAIIDPRLYQSEVSRARADLLAAEAELGQAQALLTQVEAEAKRAVVHYELAQKELDRQVLLLRQNATSQQEVDITEAELQQSQANVLVANTRIQSAHSAIVAAQAAVTVAQSNLELAEINLQYTEIRAPIDGRISSRYVIREPDQRRWKRRDVDHDHRFASIPFTAISTPMNRPI